MAVSDVLPLEADRPASHSGL